MPTHALAGSSWSFQAFYSTFRDEVSRELGMSSYTQLSLYSPIVQKRHPTQQRVSCEWMSRSRSDSFPLGGIPMKPESIPMKPESRGAWDDHPRGQPGKRILHMTTATDIGGAAAPSTPAFDPAPGMAMVVVTERSTSPQLARPSCAAQLEGGVARSVASKPEEPRFKRSKGKVCKLPCPSRARGAFAGAASVLRMHTRHSNATVFPPARR